MSKLNRYQKLFKELSTEKFEVHQNLNDHIVVIDGLNTFIRSFGATPSTNEDGDHVGGITGFLYSVGKVVRDFKPTRCIIVFDGKGGSKRRRSLNSNYKANRANKTRLRRHDHSFADIEDEQEAMRHQFSRLISYLDNLPVTFLSIDGIEADDTIAYIAEQYRDISKKITIVSTDRDFYQMIDETIQVWSPVKKRMYDIQQLHDEFGVSPENYVIYRTFTGDKSDNIEGVSGIGPKTILKNIPEISSRDEFTLDMLFEKCEAGESTRFTKSVLQNKSTLEVNYKLMNLKLLDFPAQTRSIIRDILDQPIPRLNRLEFQRIFMEDKLWAVMRNLPEWLTKTWLQLDSFAVKQ